MIGASGRISVGESTSLRLAAALTLAACSAGPETEPSPMLEPSTAPAGHEQAQASLPALPARDQMVAARNPSAGPAGRPRRPEHIDPTPGGRLEPNSTESPPVAPRALDPWIYGGNSPTAADAKLGTNNNVAFEIKVNGFRSMRFEPNATSPNLVGGHRNNSSVAGETGSTGSVIAGGGTAADPNIVSGTGLTCSGGAGHEVFGQYSTVIGGFNNLANGSYAIAGGKDAHAVANHAVAIGLGASASAVESISIGTALSNLSMNSVVLGARNRSGGGTLNAWHPFDSIFEVGNGAPGGPTSTALQILKNGDVAIGAIDPKNRLEVHADTSHAVNAHLMLKETANDWARMTFSNTATTNKWAVAGLPHATAASAQFNFWYDSVGSVMTLDGGGNLWVKNFGPGLMGHALCATEAMGGGKIGRCSSSRRYKKDIASFEPGLEIVERLRSVSFTSINGGERALGFIAEEVAKVHPLLATYDDKGRPEGVRYMELTAVLSNAIKEQQRTIGEQEKKLAELENLVKKQERLLDENTRAMRALSDVVSKIGKERASR
jgi:hypothetical protein